MPQCPRRSPGESPRVIASGREALANRPGAVSTPSALGAAYAVGRRAQTRTMTHGSAGCATRWCRLTSAALPTTLDCTPPPREQTTREARIKSRFIITAARWPPPKTNNPQSNGPPQPRGAHKNEIKRRRTRFQVTLAIVTHAQVYNSTDVDEDFVVLETWPQPRGWSWAPPSRPYED